MPVGVVGGEEQMPALFTSKRLGKLFGLPVLPVPAVPVPLPVRYHLHYGPPIPVQEIYTPDQADDPEVVKAVAAEVQEAVDRLLKVGLENEEAVRETGRRFRKTVLALGGGRHPSDVFRI